MLPVAGQRFGPYEILGKLGSGGMGIVFRAWDERLHREVAIKLLHDEYTTPGMRDRFLLEARAASALNHPNICMIFDMGEQDGEPYLVMELLEGMTLKQKISVGAVAMEDLVRISAEVSEAMAAAHAKGIVHRDIKPANIFLVRKPGGKPQAKVLDFGLAKINQASRAGWASRSIEITTAGSTVGTLAYMSPEQARGEPLDARSDLFSLGVVMYEMATRRVPFRGPTSALVYVELLSKMPDPIRQWNETVPKDLERLIFRLLAKDRSERFQTATELHGALHKLATRGDGDWLKKVPRASVPLVEAPDPIARENRMRRKDTDSWGLSPEVRGDSGESEELNSDEGGDLIRPKRLPVRESGPRESAFRLNEASPGIGAEPAGHVDEPKPISGSSHASAQPGSDELGVAPPASVAPVSGRDLRVLPAAAAEPLAPGPVAELEPPSAAAPKVNAKISGEVPAASVGGFHAAAKTGAGVEPEVEVAEERAPGEGGRSSRPGLKIAVGLLGLAALGFALWIRGGGLGRVVLAPTDSVLLTAVQNKTGDPTLDGAVMEGLEIDLAQSPLRWMGQEVYRAGIRQIAATAHGEPHSISSGREAAQQVGARAYVYGEVSGGGAPYTINVEVVEASSNDKLASLSETAVGKAELPHAIDRLAGNLRRSLGEDAHSITGHNTPLSAQATGSVPALSYFAEAEDARGAGHLQSAIDLYGKALREAPGFALAEVQLAWLEEGQDAELAAADAARHARLNSGQAGDRVRLLAELSAEALDAQDLGAAGIAARRLLALYPRDTTAMVSLARVMRLQGHMTEALLSAEQAFRQDATDADAYAEGGRALLGLDRYPEALKLTETAKQAGVAHLPWTVGAQYLSGQGAAPASAAELAEPDIGMLADRANALDNSGALAAGAEAWHTAARAAQGSASLASAGAAMLARGAVNRALVGRCAQALSMADEAAALPYGRRADFETGVAAALCGATDRATRAEERLQREGGHHSLTEDYYLPVLRGTLALGAKDAMRAQEAMSGVHQMRDQPPLSIALLGLAHIAAHHEELAVEDFRTIDAHRGYAFEQGTVAYPVALFQLGRTEAVVRQMGASAAAYQRFARLWSGAEASDPLLAEALERSR